MNYKVEYIVKCAESLKIPDAKTKVVIKRNASTGMFELLKDDKLIVPNLYPVDYTILSELQQCLSKKDIALV